MRIAEKLIKEFGECLIQKELGLMSANNLLSGYVTCRTDYSGSKANGAYRSSYGFWFQGTNVTVHATDADLKVRCVKDVK